MATNQSFEYTVPVVQYFRKRFGAYECVRHHWRRPPR